MQSLGPCGSGTKEGGLPGCFPAVGDPLGFGEVFVVLVVGGQHESSDVGCVVEECGERPYLYAQYLYTELRLEVLHLLLLLL